LKKNRRNAMRQKFLSKISLDAARAIDVACFLSSGSFLAVYEKFATSISMRAPQISITTRII